MYKKIKVYDTNSTSNAPVSVFARAHTMTGGRSHGQNCSSSHLRVTPTMSRRCSGRTRASGSCRAARTTRFVSGICGAPWSSKLTLWHATDTTVLVQVEITVQDVRQRGARCVFARSGGGVVAYDFLMRQSTMSVSIPTRERSSRPTRWVP